MYVCVLAWDNDTIDHWHIEKFKEGDMPKPLTEESSFATLFPKYREKYLQKVWPHVTRILKVHVRTTPPVAVLAQVYVCMYVCMYIIHACTYV